MPNAAAPMPSRVASPFMLFEDGREGGRALLFEEPREIICARTPEEVPAAFERMEAARRRGLHLAGYASYELGYALEPKFATQPTPEPPTPLLLFGVFEAARPYAHENADAGFDPIALT
ncbi:MAG TPA: aminodeoxychorismate synthase component I, partial [Methylocystis sp.]|nr:aminodeoxychorismate synthase component I [Methylocystis sp.]